MLFTSYEFFLFIPLIFILYWWIGKKGVFNQNLILLIASYFFYAWWDWRFLFLILISSFTDFIAGIQLEKSSSKKTKKVWLWLSIIINVGLLGFFKYCNFFIDSLVASFELLEINLRVETLSIILPIGISFYTFQTLAYTIDIYRSKIKAEKSILIYLTYVSFFPQLLAGPIERAANLLPQFHRQRTFDLKLAADGARQLLWGFFMKIAVADFIGSHIDKLFVNPESHSSALLFQGIIFFAIQVYADFSGYSHIAIGTAKLFGIKLMDNFLFPFFSRNLTELWQRWHISLTTWFRDYVYIPLGGNRLGKTKQFVALMTTFLISGFWHGASWNIVVWGLLNGLLFSLMLFFEKKKELDSPAKLGDIAYMILTFLLFSLPLILFRNSSLSSSFLYFNQMISINGPIEILNSKVFSLVFCMIGLEWIQREKKHALAIAHWSFYKRYITYTILICWISYNLRVDNPFIYFQF